MVPSTSCWLLNIGSIETRGSTPLNVWAKTDFFSQLEPFYKTSTTSNLNKTNKKNFFGTVAVQHWQDRSVSQWLTKKLRLVLLAVKMRLGLCFLKTKSYELKFYWTIFSKYTRLAIFYKPSQLPWKNEFTCVQILVLQLKDIRVFCSVCLCCAGGDWPGWLWAVLTAATVNENWAETSLGKLGTENRICTRHICEICVITVTFVLNLFTFPSAKYDTNNKTITEIIKNDIKSSIFKQ